MKGLKILPAAILLSVQANASSLETPACQNLWVEFSKDVKELKPESAERYARLTDYWRKRIQIGCPVYGRNESLFREMGPDATAAEVMGRPDEERGERARQEAPASSLEIPACQNLWVEFSKDVKELKPKSAARYARLTDYWRKRIQIGCPVYGRNESLFREMGPDATAAEVMRRLERRLDEERRQEALYKQQARRRAKEERFRRLLAIEQEAREYRAWKKAQGYK